MKRILYILALALSIVACTEEIDKSNRYTFTGETVALVNVVGAGDN